MKTPASQIFEAPANIVFLIPADLREWLNDASLMAAARESAELFYWVGAGGDDDHPPVDGRVCPMRKLALFTYCCACGIDATEDIAASLFGESSPAVAGGSTSATRRKMTADPVFPADKLRLFRAHNSELIKLCLARVLEQAWTAKFGTAPRRDFFAAEAGRRVRLAFRADPASRSSRREEAHSFTHHMPRTTPNQSLVTPSATRNGFAAAAVVLLALFLFLLPARATETLPPFKLDGRAYTNAVVIESNPVDVLIRQEELGFKRLKRQEMPAELKDRFPHDAKEVEEYEKQKAARALAQREQQRRDAYHALLRQERELIAQIDRAERDLMALQKEINVRKSQAHKRPRSAERQVVIQCQERKIALERHIENLRRHLEAVRASQTQYR